VPSLFSLDDRPPRRHDLIFVRPAAWRALLAGRDDLNGEPLVARWADRGWPLVRRRALPGEGAGVPLGLPLPPSAGIASAGNPSVAKRRLSFLVPPSDVIAVSPPLALRAVVRAAPRAWQPTLDRIEAWASRYAVDVRVFGGLAWRTLTELHYLTARSDLDLLLHVYRDADLGALTEALARIEATAPMAIDGEIVRDDGVAVNWREIHARQSELLAKSTDGVTLIDAKVFLAGQAPPS
jgi:phosphoribosyl-dephospho-CoA transferase